MSRWMNPEEITLLQVVETIIGEIFLNDCVIRPESCKVSPNCSVHTVWMSARDQLRKTLASVTFAQPIEQPICISE